MVVVVVVVVVVIGVVVSVAAVPDLNLLSSSCLFLALSSRSAKVTAIV